MSPIPDPNDDPDKHSDENDITNMTVDTPQIINVHSSSDTDDDEEDENGYHGYQQLPQEPENSQLEGDAVAPGVDSPHVTLDDVVMHQLNQADFTEFTATSPSLASTLGLPEEGLPLTESVWKDTVLGDNMPLEQEQADKIKAAMVGFQLPANQMPEWAKHIPEEKWKARLVERLKNIV